MVTILNHIIKEIKSMNLGTAHYNKVGTFDFVAAIQKQEDQNAQNHDLMYGCKIWSHHWGSTQMEGIWEEGAEDNI